MDAWIALAVAVVSGIGLKITDHYLNKNRVRVDDAARMRDELRIEITAQRSEIGKLEVERDKWRADYYDLRDQFTKLQTELTIALQKIKGITQE